MNNNHSDQHDIHTDSLTIWQNVRLLFWNMLPFVIILFVLTFLISQLWFMIKAKQIEIKDKRIADALGQKDVSINVVTCKLEKGSLIDNIMLPGQVSPWEELTIQAQVSGKITEIKKDEGDYVEKGEIIALIDDRDYKAAVNISKTRLDRELKDYQRAKNLYQKNVVSLSSFEELEADLREAESNFEMDRLKLERCSIKAPFSGYINQRFISVGSLVVPGSNIAEILDTLKVKVDIRIPEADIDQVRDLTTAQIRIVSLKNKVLTGRKIFLSHRPDTDTHTYLLRLEVDNKDQVLRSGMFVEADIIREDKKDIIIAPLYSIVAKGNERFCFVVKNGKTIKTPVEIGVIKRGIVEIVSGLKFGDHLIIKGQRQVDDNQPVTVIQTIPLDTLTRITSVEEFKRLSSEAEKQGI